MKHFSWRALALGVWTLLLIMLWNSDFEVYTWTKEQLQMNDVSAIVAGFRATPHFWSDAGRWWHGPWIENGIEVFRPLSSMMLWWECYVGFRFGWIWIAWWGMALFWAACGLTVALAWRATRSWWCALGAATLMPTLQFWNMGGSQPGYWLAWMPVHHDLLMLIAMLGALLCFDLWIDTGARGYLIGCWGALVVGALSKEYVYIFPLLALLWGWGQSEKAVSRARLTRVVALMGAFVIALFIYRWAVLPQPYNPPPLKRVHLIRRPFLYWFAPFYKYLLTGTWWVPAQVAATLAILACWVRALQMRRHWPLLPTFLALLASLALPLVPVWALGTPPGEAVWYYLEPTGAWLHIGDFVSMLFLLWASRLLWKYRESEPTLATLGIFLAIYLPVFTYLGWHYCLAGGFVRGALWWPLLAKLVWRDTRGWLMPTVTQRDKVEAVAALDKR